MVGLSDGEVPLIPSGVGVLPKEKKNRRVVGAAR